MDHQFNICRTSQSHINQQEWNKLKQQDPFNGNLKSKGGKHNLCRKSLSSFQFFDVQKQNLPRDIDTFDKQKQTIMHKSSTSQIIRVEDNILEITKESQTKTPVDQKEIKQKPESSHCRASLNIPFTRQMVLQTNVSQTLRHFICSNPDITAKCKNAHFML